VGDSEKNFKERVPAIISRQSTGHIIWSKTLGKKNDKKKRSCSVHQKKNVLTRDSKRSDSGKYLKGIDKTRIHGDIIKVGLTGISPGGVSHEQGCSKP